MRYWNNWESHGIANVFQTVEGFRPMSCHNGSNSGLRLYTQTPRVNINDVANPGSWTWTSKQGGLGNASNVGAPDEVIFCCHDIMSTSNPTNIINFWKGSFFDVDWLLSLPYFTTLGNTPVGGSAPKWNDLVLQLYQAGGWFWTEGGWPPIKGPSTESIDIRPIYNYEFHMDECWDGTNLQSYVDSSNQSPSTVSGTAPSVTGSYTLFPWDATFDFNSIGAIVNTWGSYL